MPRSIRTLVAAIAAVALSGCSTLQPLGDSQRLTRGIAAPDPAPLEVGHDLRFTLADGARIEMRVVAVRADVIEGTQGGQPVRVTLDQVSKIERRVWDVPRTAVLVFAALVLAVAQPFSGSAVVLGFVP